MPATCDFPRHTNPQALRAGLVLQARSRVTHNEFGLAEATFTFETFNENYPRLVPERGTPCDKFVGGADLTKRVLKQFNFLGAQTSELVRGGGDAVAMFTVTCQGALFPPLQPGDSARTIGKRFSFTGLPFSGLVGAGFGTTTPGTIALPRSFITTPWTPSSRTKDSASFIIYSGGPDTFIPQLAVFMDYFSIDLHYEYLCRVEPENPVFLQEEYKADDKGYITVDAYGRKKKLSITNITVDRLVGTITDGTFATAGLSVAIQPSDYLPWIKFIGINSRFDVEQAGQYFHVTETNTVKIAGNPPSNGAAFASA